MPRVVVRVQLRVFRVRIRFAMGEFRCFLFFALLLFQPSSERTPANSSRIGAKRGRPRHFGRNFGEFCSGLMAFVCRNGASACSLPCVLADFTPIRNRSLVLFSGMKGVIKYQTSKHTSVFARSCRTPGGAVPTLVGVKIHIFKQMH